MAADHEFAPRSAQSNFEIGARVRAAAGSIVAGTVTGYDENGRPIVRWDNGTTQGYGGTLVRAEA